MTNSLWECPNCGRKFTSRNQSHSCLKLSEEFHFLDKPPVLSAIYETLKIQLSQWKGIRISPVKSSITLASQSTFAVMFVHKTGLKIEFILPYDIDSERIYKSKQVDEQNYVHFIKIESPEQIDEELVTWLKQSFDYKQ